MSCVPPFRPQSPAFSRLRVLAALVLPVAVVAGAETTVPPTVSPATAPTLFEASTAPVPASRLDDLVFGRLATLGLQPAPSCSDSVFIRRVYLDVIGTLPTAAEVRSFLAETRADKRAVLIDRLLGRDEFADYWTMRWCDILRVKSEFPINLWPNAAQEYHRWIFTAVRDNLPYDRFAHALLVSSGSNFRAGAVNFYRTAQSRDAQGVAKVAALTFLGERTDGWKPEQVRDLAAFFSAIGSKYTQEWKEEIVYFDPEKLPATGLPTRFPDGHPIQLTRDRDPREVFAAWLTGPGRDAFAAAFVNRAWAWLLGRGIVEPADDFRAGNPPSNPELLAFLRQEFIARHYNVKALFRLILNSQTYQLASTARSDRPEAAANFASYPLRRLDAEVLIDALNQVTGTTEKYSSAIPEPYTFIPETQRSIALPDGSITSSFLEMFGRPARDTGEQDERINRITSGQRLHLLNSTQVQRKIEQGPKLQALFRSGRPPGEIVNELYLSILSRPPTADERAVILEYAARHDRRTTAVDVAWALLNSTEFLFRH